MLTNLETLEIDTLSGQELTFDLFPKSLTSLKFETFCNNKMPLKEGSLPPNLKYFEPGKQFESLIEVGALPQTLEYLKLYIHPNGRSFGKDILPNSLKLLSLYGYFNISEFETSNSNIKVKYFILNSYFQTNLTSPNIMNKIETLIFSGPVYLNNNPPYILPPNLTTLEFSSVSLYQFNNFKMPNSLTKLSIYNFNFNLSCEKYSINLKDKTSIKHLSISFISNHKELFDLSQLPLSLKTLKLENFRDDILIYSTDSQLLGSLKKIYINSSEFNPYLIDSLLKEFNNLTFYIEKQIINSFLNDTKLNLLKYYNNIKYY